jgi:hypothetical protein
MAGWGDSYPVLFLCSNHAMKNIIVKGKSEKAGFSMNIPQEELMAFLQMVVEKSAEEYDAELATSPGGLPTALFNCNCPANAREDAGWKMEDGWSLEKATKTFESRLERKQGGGGFSLETRQATWDAKAAELRSYNVPELGILKALGKRPEAKVPVSKGMDELKAAGIV